VPIPAATQPSTTTAAPQTQVKTNNTAAKSAPSPPPPASNNTLRGYIIAPGQSLPILSELLKLQWAQRQDELRAYQEESVRAAIASRVAQLVKKRKEEMERGKEDAQEVGRTETESKHDARRRPVRRLADPEPAACLSSK
jgi:hypothetical protein